MKLFQIVAKSLIKYLYAIERTAPRHSPARRDNIALMIFDDTAFRLHPSGRDFPILSMAQRVGVYPRLTFCLRRQPATRMETID
jgi:hypothetical protein